MPKNRDGVEIKVGDTLMVVGKVLEFSDNRVELEVVCDPRVKLLVHPNVIETVKTVEVEKIVTKTVEKVVEVVKYNDIPQDVVDKLGKNIVDVVVTNLHLYNKPNEAKVDKVVEIPENKPKG